MNLPDETTARLIAERHVDTGSKIERCERFATGLRHWVYDVVFASGQNVVVRLSHPDHRLELAGGVFWQQELRGVGVRVPDVLAFDVEGDQPYMILERLTGTDLGNVFDHLSERSLARVAESVADMQQRTSRLIRADGYGYALGYDDPSLRQSWFEVIEDSVVGAKRRIEEAGVVDPAIAEPVVKLVTGERMAFDDVKPVAFLHDATTKNVIVADGRVTGLVDVDQMAFGDPLWAVALTRMSLRSAKHPTTYIDLLLSHDNTADKRRLDLYTAIFCLGFLAELGHTHNQSEPAIVNQDHQRHLESTLRDLLQAAT